MKPRIHCVALVSVDFDADVLPYFLPHYRGLDLDNYCLFLHEGKNTDANLWAEKAAQKQGWKTRFVPHNASFQDGELKRVLLNKFQKALKPEDYILCADGDEIQGWEASPSEYARAGYDMVLGRVADRFAEKLIPVDHTLDLEDNFPLEHENLNKLLFPERPHARDKILLSRAAVPVDFKKSLRLTRKMPANFKVIADIPVYSYKWRDTLLHRLRERTEYTPQNIGAIREFFK